MDQLSSKLLAERPEPVRNLVSAVVLTYNKCEYTRLCLEGLLRTAYRPLEIIVVDNGSTDGAREMLAEMQHKAGLAGVPIKTRFNETNAGAPTARNQGIEMASGEMLLFIDNDAVPFSPGWLGRLVESLRCLPDAGVVSARLIYPFEPHLVQFAGCGISRTGRVKYLGRGASRTDPLYTGVREVQCLISACILARAAVVREAGGFDEAFNPVQYEDLDLCYRVRELGHRCYVVGDAEVCHFENTTTDGSQDINFRYVTIKNGLLFKDRWRRRFAQEDGPADSETAWLELEQRTLQQMGIGWTPWEQDPAPGLEESCNE
jgi:GT2 family glycosyltransferase